MDVRRTRRPEDGLTKERYYPNIDRTAMVTKGYVAFRSSHSRGSAIDLTLYRLDTGTLLPMGSTFDFMDECSHSAAKSISGKEAQNRMLLQSVMKESGFKPYEYEWWHYVLRKEPYPDVYFDFPVS